LDPNPPLVANVVFRRALLHAIDRQALADTFLGGLVEVAHTFVSPNDADYRDIEGSIVRYDYSPSRGSQSIEGLGYRKGGDGFFRDSANQQLALEFRTTALEPLPRMTLAMADQWQRVGVVVEPVVIPAARVPDREYRAGFPAFQMFRQPNDLAFLRRLHSSQAPVPETRFVGTNYARYRVAEWDSLLDRLFATVPRSDRMAVLREIVHHLSDQLNLMPLVYNAYPIAVRDRVVNVTASHSAGVSHSWNAHEWDVQ
jgi:peptide/nickel transport system substrate-binding protein